MSHYFLTQSPVTGLVTVGLHTLLSHLPSREGLTPPWLKRYPLMEISPLSLGHFSPLCASLARLGLLPLASPHLACR